MSEYRPAWLCPVCRSKIQTPVAAPCGHVFCWSCLTEHLKTASSCPVCFSEVDASTWTPIYGQGAQPSGEDPRRIQKQAVQTAPPPPPGKWQVLSPFVVMLLILMMIVMAYP